LPSLCITTELSGSELASWVQAIGSIVAIVAAAGIAIWQSRQQHKSALALHREERRRASFEAAKSLLALCQNCTRAAAHFASELCTREGIYKVASGAKHFDFEELTALRDAVASIQLHQLPDVLISPAMALAATVRQLRQTIEIAIREHRKMDADAFRSLFKTLNDMTASLAATTDDIRIQVDRQQAESAPSVA
jgi:cell fate (sporulation/competence/biofilm development) regulator YlbF (YheA/YmcA/DUF963 family)